MGEIRVFVLLLPVIVASMVLHELAHAWTAWRLGDPTARRMGRLTLNPVPHIDPLGTAMFALTYFAAGVMFGWARPVPVMPAYFRHPQRGMAVVAVAGPVTNFVIALVLTAVWQHARPSGETALDVLELAIVVNIVLGVFNLLPIPPLDGSRIVGVFMDADTYRRWSALDQYGMLALLALFLLFQRPFTLLLTSARDRTFDVLLALVGG